MMESAHTIELNENNLQLKSSPKKTGNFAVLFVLSVLLIFFTGLALATGYLWGRFQSRPQEKVEKTDSKQPASKTGQNIYEDKSNNFKLSYPDGWKATARATGISGVIMAKEKSSVEIWLSVDQPVIFGTEQKAALVTTNNLSLKIDGQTAKMTENIFSAGNYFSIIKLAANQSNPLVTIWLKAENQEVYTQTQTIAQSFSFNQ